MRTALVLSLLTVLAGSLPAPVTMIAPAVKQVEYQIPESVRARVKTSRIADVPMSLRHRNWGAGGSCVHASMVYLLHWQGQHQLAENWRQRYSGGETLSGLKQKLEAHEIGWAETTNGDESFLEAATENRRGCGVVVHGGSHMVNLVGLSKTTAHIWDSNEPERIQPRDRDAFLQEWRQSGGWAITPLAGQPMAPKPFIVKSRWEN